MTLREEVVLAPRDPNIADDNDWPEFRLSEVTVYGADGISLTSLFTASNQSPVLVRGRLDELESNQEHLVLDENGLEQLIQLSNVKRFAYGQYDDGTVGIWAEGRAGWFAVEAAADYKAIFGEMEEAIDILYFLIDRYKKSGTKRGHKDLKSTEVQCRYLFKKYIEHKNHRYDDVDEAAEAFYKHREFLIMSMLSGKEGIGWSSSPFYRHLRQKFPDDFARIKAKLVEVREDPESDEEQDLNPQPATKPSKIVAEALPTREKGKARQKLDLLDKEDSDEEMAREDIGTSRRHKRKSVLRPKSSRYASKGAGKGSGVGPVDHQEDSDGEDVTIMNVPLPKKTPVPRNTRAAKRIRVDLGSTDVAWAEPVVSESENHHHAESRPAAESGEPPSASTKPQGPGDTWSCAVDGCTYKVYQARKAKPQQMITEHLTDHNARAQDKLDLVFEEERPHLPITNLIHRIHKIAATQPLPDGTFPKPIHRRY